ncbi:MAG: hypothetical protein M3144_11605 [Actinomycetota bacterium]|nr:hypothetical protein [Actinomycetota bacterium]
MKRAVLLAVLFAAAVAGVDWLGDLTQDRPDRVSSGSRTEVVLDVRVRHDRAPANLATAQGLWGACQNTVRQRLAAPGLVDLGGGRFRAVTEPAIGEHAWRRLQGCLEDMTIDRVRGEVVAKRNFTAAPPG